MFETKYRAMMTFIMKVGTCESSSKFNLSA